MRFTMIAMGVVLACGQICSGEYYKFEWGGRVERIVDGADVDASLSGVNVGDLMTSQVVFDPATFGPGVNVIGDGLDYAAPAGLQMTYSFSSGGVFAHDVTGVRARDDDWSDQWNWQGGPGGLLLQFNDYTEDAWEPPLPSSFVDMFDLYRGALSHMRSTGNERLVLSAESPVDWWTVWIDANFLSVGPAAVEAVPAPAAILLTGFGAGLVSWLRRRRSL